MIVDGRVSATGVATGQEGSPVFMSWVADDAVPRPHRRFVRRAADKASKRLGIGSVRIRYFRAATDEPDFWVPGHGDEFATFGVAPHDQPMTIGIHADLRGDRLVVAVVAHEVRHVTQDPDEPHAERERDADDFTARYMGAR